MSSRFQDPHDFRRDFQQRLVHTRAVEMDISQEEMASRLECSKSQYPKYENRKDQFPLYLLPRLIDVTEKPYSYWVLGIPVSGEKRGKPPKGNERFQLVK